MLLRGVGLIARIVLVDASVDGPDMVTVTVLCAVEFTLGSLWVHFEFTLGSHWGQLRSLWGHFEVTLGSLSEK